MFGLNFALRAGDEHRLLRVGPNSQVKTFIESKGEKKLKYTEDISKSNRGGMKDRKIEKKTVVIGRNDQRPERCVIRLYEKYMGLRPKGGKCVAFYLRPLRFPKGDAWYADQPIGVHPLRSTVGRICAEAGFKGYYTNHSLRATVATRLYSEGVDEQLIAEKTGHRSGALRNYKRTSAKLEEHIDDIVQRKVQRVLSSPTATISRPPTPVLTSDNDTATSMIAISNLY